MLRSLEDVANATPKDYLAHVPKDAMLMAQKMIGTARQKNPIPNIDDGKERFQNYDFLYVGPGSGLVVQNLIQLGQAAFGMETSKRGIKYGSPDEIRSYVLWAKPWESPFAFAEHKKPFHVGILSDYYKKILTPEEWKETVAEMKRICRYIAVFKE